MALDADSGTWWSERSIAVGEGLRWTLGTLEVSMCRQEHEWQVAYGASGRSEDSDEASVEPIAEIPETADATERYAVYSTRSAARCRPALADRSVVVRPRMPVFIPPRERIRIFVSSPIWIRAEIGTPWQNLRDLPVKRLSDTWVGSTTREGELAYALSTQARVRLEQIPTRHHRAMTSATIVNDGEDTLSVERLNLPVPHLSIYATDDLRLWTEAVTMRRREGHEMAQLEIGDGPPAEAPGATLLAEPRQHAEDRQIVRAFAELLHTLTLGGGD